MHTLLPVFVLLAGCGSEPPPPEAPPPAAPAALPARAPSDLAGAVGEPVALRGRDLVLSLQGVEVQVSYLEGRLVPSGDFVDTEAPSSFEVWIDAVEVRLSDQATGRAFAREDGPIHELEVTSSGDAFDLEGSLAFLRLPFSFRADPGVTEDGRLTLDLEEVAFLGVGVKRFVAAIGRSVDHKSPVLTVVDEVVILDPFPTQDAPIVHATFTDAFIEEGVLVARLGDPPQMADWPESGLVLSGGVLRAGGSVLFDTTLRMVPEDGGTLTIDPETFDAQQKQGFTKMGEDRTITLHLAPPGGVDEG